MATAILQIVAAIGGIVATWYVGKKALQWLQKYYDWQNVKKVEDVKKQSEDIAKKNQSESDRLKEIEGRGEG